MGDDLTFSRVPFSVASKLRDGYTRKLSAIYNECRMDRGSGHRDAKTMAEARGGGAYLFFGFVGLAYRRLFDGDSWSTSLEDQPLMTTATFNNVWSEVDMELTLIIKAYAATVDGFDGGIGSPLDAWESVVTVAGG